MLQWLIIGLLYALGFGFFGLIGGLGSAGEAFRSWGESAAARRGRASSS
jgi:hypothetical protein